MAIRPVGSVATFGNKRLLTQAKKVIDETMGVTTQVTHGTYGLTVKIPGRDGCINIFDWGNSNPFDMAKNFATVQKAIKDGILKVRHVSRIGL